MRNRLIAIAAVGMLGALTACSGDAEPPAPTGPITIEFWSGAGGSEAVAEAFNSAHTDIQLKYVNVPAGEIVKNLKNAHKAGDAGKVPCLVQSDNRNGGALLGEGVIADITKLFAPHKDKFVAGGIESLTLAGVTYGVPDRRDPLFSMFYKPVFTERGLTYPTTWEELIAIGPALRKDGIYVFNLAGEDPSTLMGLAWQAGARWYSIEGDAWKVNFTDEASLWSASIMQQLLDKDIVQKISYAEYAAMMQQYDEGKIAMRQVSTWQLAGHQRNMKTSLGKWEPAANLLVKGKTEPISAADTGGLVVPSLCANPEAAVTAAVRLASDAGPVSTMGSPVDGSGWFPAVADATPYIDAVVPKQLWGDHSTKGAEVITAASTVFASDWIYGPNSTAMYEELADQWGKAMNGDITVASILEHMQKWTIDDLKQKGVSVVE